MNIWRYLLLFLALLVLVGSVGALVPDTVVVSTSQRWLTTGGVDTSVVSVQVINSTNPGAPVTGAAVIVWCDDVQMGSITPSTPLYVGNTSQLVNFTFRTGTKSGNAVIHARVTHPERIDPIESTTIQRIDHAAPAAFAELAYPAVSPVGSEVQIAIRLKDRYGNMVDSRKEDDLGTTAEIISLRDSEDGDGGFKQGSVYVNAVDIPVNITGYVAVTYRVASTAGQNIISVKTPSGMSPNQVFISIDGIGVLSANITAEVNPSTGVLYANNYDTASILYTVRDVDGNPVRNATINRISSLGETDTYKTNDQGQVITSYGPKSSVGVVNLIATVEGYPSVMNLTTLQFVHTEAALWELTASPQTLASRDVKPDITADIRVKVMDILGNPVENETVTFSITGTTNTTRLDAYPELINTSATTDIDGFAIVQIRPGEFPIWGEADYNQTATGTTTVRALWNGKEKTIQIIFKNYPYLRVETAVSPQTVQVNQTVDVTVWLIGDGYALRPKPIDVVLCTDRSGSMLYDDPDRMYSVREAAKEFVDQMTTQDRVGVVSFGRNGYISRPGYNSGISTWEIDNTYSYPVTYSGYATLDKSLSYDFGAVKTKLDQIVPDHGTPMREGARRSISHLTSSGRPSAIQAIILLSDGDYNWYGDPLARGTGYTSYDPDDFGDLTSSYYKYTGLGTGINSNQNMSNYAKNNSIIIYSIGYADQISTQGRNTLRTLAESTGGKYFDGNAANIAEIYRTIAGDLRTVAGVNTTMNLSFENINVTFNNVTSMMPGNAVFSYQYLSGTSTYITSWNETMNPLPGHTPSYPYTVDQSAQWNHNPPYLAFDVGNISINQTWQTIFRLKALTPGSVNIFGSGSVVRFDGTEGPSSTSMPDTYITAIANMTTEMLNQTFLDVAFTNSSDTGPGSVKDLLIMYWNLNYTSNKTVKQDLYYQFSGDNVLWTNDWIHAGTFMAPGGPYPNIPFNATIDTVGKSGFMKIRIVAKEQLTGGAYDEDIWPFIIQINPEDRVYIKIT